MIVKYYDTDQDKLASKEFDAGAIYYCTDTGDMYIDSVQKNTRIKIGGGGSLKYCSSLPLTPEADTLYYRTNDGNLYIYTNGGWITLNTREQIRIPDVVIENGSGCVNGLFNPDTISCVFIPDSSISDVCATSSFVCAYYSDKILIFTNCPYTLFGELVINTKVLR